MALALWRRRSLLSITEHALVHRLVGAEMITGDKSRQLTAIVERLTPARCGRPHPPPPRHERIPPMNMPPRRPSRRHQGPDD